MNPEEEEALWMEHGESWHCHSVSGRPGHVLRTRENTRERQALQNLSCCLYCFYGELRMAHLRIFFFLKMLCAQKRVAARNETWPIRGKASLLFPC